LRFDDFQDAGHARRFEPRLPEHRHPPKNGVEWRPQFVRNRGEEFVLQTIGVLRLETCSLQRDERVAQLVLALPSTQRRTHRADDGGRANRSIEERDIAQHLEFVKRSERRLTAIAAGKQQDRDIRPRRLRRQCFGKIVEPRIRERLLGQQNGACSARQLETHVVHRVADVAGNAGARQELRRQAGVAANRRENQHSAGVVCSVHHFKRGPEAPM
jgi:hypothetical protein